MDEFIDSTAFLIDGTVKGPDFLLKTNHSFKRKAAGFASGCNQVTVITYPVIADRTRVHFMSLLSKANEPQRHKGAKAHKEYSSLCSPCPQWLK